MAEPHPTGSAPTFELRHRMALALEHAGLSRDDIARELDVHRNTVANYLSGRTHPTRAVLIAWHLRTGVPLDWLEHGEHAGGDTDPGGVTRLVTTREPYCKPDRTVVLLHAA